MSKYNVSAIKSLSAVKRYEYIRSKAYPVMSEDMQTVRVYTGDELDRYIDEQVWRENHPGQEPIEERDNGLPTE